MSRTGISSSLYGFYGMEHDQGIQQVPPQVPAGQSPAQQTQPEQAPPQQAPTNGGNQLSPQNCGQNSNAHILPNVEEIRRLPTTKLAHFNLIQVAPEMTVFAPINNPYIVHETTAFDSAHIAHSGSVNAIASPAAPMEQTSEVWQHCVESPGATIFFASLWRVPNHTHNLGMKDGTNRSYTLTWFCLTRGVWLVRYYSSVPEEQFWLLSPGRAKFGWRKWRDREDVSSLDFWGASLPEHAPEEDDNFIQPSKSHGEEFTIFKALCVTAILVSINKGPRKEALFISAGDCKHRISPKTIMSPYSGHGNTTPYLLVTIDQVAWYHQKPLLELLRHKWDSLPSLNYPMEHPRLKNPELLDEQGEVGIGIELSLIPSKV
ncbi:hypothetical protein BDV93DRAFT_548959 [Ceratobasidium sp. AG-I]|nr:hypothetical protein BDV93DRAFT_548959 [Ceratobasidium sp. AG-I]